MRHGKRRFLVAFMLPGLLLYAVFVLSPYAQAFYLAMTDWRGVSSRQTFTGLDNFVRMAHDAQFWAGVRHNGLMLLVLPVVTIVLSLFFASMLNLGGRGGKAAIQGVRGSAFYKVVYFFPQVLSVAIIAVLWQFVYTPNSGLLNGVLNSVGLGALKRSWLAEHDFALPAVMAVMVWSAVGFYVVLFSAGMQSIPREILEAALLDGAGPLATFRRITLPLLWDSVQVAFVYVGIMAMDGFAIVQIMTVGWDGGGPDGATEVIGLTLFRNAFTYGKFGYATAMGVVLFFLTLTLAALTLRMSRRERIEF